MGVWGAPFGTWGASWSQDGAQDRQEEPQEAPRQPTWRQDGPTWLQDGVPNLFQNHENSIEKILFFKLFFDWILERLGTNNRWKIESKIEENMIANAVGENYKNVHGVEARMKKSMFR